MVSVQSPQAHTLDGLCTITYESSNVVTVWLDEKKFDGTADLRTPDLDDFLKGWKPGKVFYKSTWDDSQEIRLRIAKLLEYIASHSDGASVLQHLLQVLPEHHRNLRFYERTKSTGSARICTSILPPAPEKHVVYSFGDLRPRFQRWHYVAVVPMIVAVFGLIYVQSHFIGDWMLLSPATAIISLGSKITIWGAIGLLVSLVIIDNKLGRKQKGSSYSPYTFGLLNKASVDEEQAFREGAEQWEPGQRFMSCLAFGMIHIPSMIYVFGMFVPHVLMGGVFMTVYLKKYRETNSRRTAVLAASVFHRVFNRVALYVLGVSLLAHFGFAAWNWVTALGGIAFTWVVMVGSNRRNPETSA